MFSWFSSGFTRVGVLAALFFSALPAAFSLESNARDGYTLYAEIDENGDTISNELLPTVLKRANPYDVYVSKRKRKIFWKTVRDVKKTYPYAKRIAADVMAVDSMTFGMDDDDRRKFMKKHENDLISKYKPELVKLTLRQGKLLIILVDRQCQRTSYSLIKEYRGGASAFFWQGFATILGANLKSGYDKEENEVIEYVIDLYESGQI
ncbi:MAG: DUF4294 domain-containing protein [Paludibacteraceae bacterium]|nr:DUF4294 domain-containing protein [Candidatus Physcocola equi]MCQ2233749.1 DUF4294 domain-containing protein [Paludibacteraceae bacterium]